MTDHGTTAYRRIGEHQEDEVDAGPTEDAQAAPGLRRISTEQPPAKDRARRPETSAPTEEAGDDWSVPHPDDLSGDAATPSEDDAEKPATPRAHAKARRSEPRRAAEPRRRPTVTVVALAVITVLLAAAVVVLGILYAGQSNRDSLRSSALSTARADGVLLSSYDYRNLNGPGSDFSKVEAVASPTFRRNFLQTSASLGKLLTQYNATAKGTVLSAGLASFSDKRAVVLLFIDQQVTNTAQKGSTSTQPLRTQLTLVRQGGRWLVDDLQVPK